MASGISCFALLPRICVYKLPNIKDQVRFAELEFDSSLNITTKRHSQRLHVRMQCHTNFSSDVAGKTETLHNNLEGQQDLQIRGKEFEGFQSRDAHVPLLSLQERESCVRIPFNALN